MQVKELAEKLRFESCERLGVWPSENTQLPEYWEALARVALEFCEERDYKSKLVRLSGEYPTDPEEIEEE